MIITSYDDWAEQRYDENPEVECPTCEGTGIITGFGGTFDSDLCDSCQGSCFLPVQDLGAWAKLYAFPVGEYTRQLAKELTLLAEWLGEPVEEIVISAGLVPYTRIAEKQEYRPGCEPRMQFVCWKSYGLDVRLSEEASS